MKNRLFIFSVLLTIVAVVSIVVFQTNNYPRFAGDFINSPEEAPERIRVLIEHMERMPPNCSFSEFGRRIERFGLNAEPNHFKDSRYSWVIEREPDNFPSFELIATFSLAPELKFFPGRQRKNVLQDAAITKRVAGHRKPVWKINYAKQ